MRKTNPDVDKAFAAARATEGDTRPSTVFLPTQQAQAWRVQLRNESSDELTTVMVDDRIDAATKVVPLSGDRVASWIRSIHEGSNSGPVWRFIVFLFGVFPTIFAITGLMIWLRSRDAKKAAFGMQRAP